MSVRMYSVSRKICFWLLTNWGIFPHTIVIGAAWEIRHVVDYFPLVVVNIKHGQRILKLAAMIVREVVSSGTES